MRGFAGATAGLLLVVLSGCGLRAEPVSPPTPTTTAQVSPVAASSRLVPWRGPVEELFVHPLVVDPRLAFRDDSLGRGFADYFVTATEFRRLLDQLWRNGWTLVDVHRAANGTVRVPPGRRPLVLSEDDVNYYRYFEGRGLARRLVLDHGRVRAELEGGVLSDDDVVPLVEAAVARHPELSADGARGVLAVTGFEGLLGEHEAATPAGRARLRPLVAALRAAGWTFASHTYGHLDLGKASPGRIRADMARWHALADPVLGPVDVLVYPYGARPAPAMIRALGAAGWPIQLDIDVVARTEQVGPAVVMSRRHVDGLAFDVPARQRPFYDVATVRDPLRPR